MATFLKEETSKVYYTVRCVLIHISQCTRHEQGENQENVYSSLHACCSNDFPTETTFTVVLQRKGSYYCSKMSINYIKTKIMNVNNVPKRFVKPILKCRLPTFPDIRPHPRHLRHPAQASKTGTALNA